MSYECKIMIICLIKDDKLIYFSKTKVYSQQSGSLFFIYHF